MYIDYISASNVPDTAVLDCFRVCWSKKKPMKKEGSSKTLLLFQSSLQKGLKVCATPKTFLWRYLRIKAHDNMLNFLFAKTRRSFLIQSTNIFLWATFTLYSIKYAILNQFWAFSEKITPWTAKNISKPVVNFKSWCNSSNWIVFWFADLFTKVRV